MRRVLLLCSFFALAFPAGALAHATLKAEQPQFRERFEASPARVVLRFDQGVDALANSIVVYDVRGKIVSEQARNGADPRTVLAPLRRLPRGAYTVRWHAVSSDSHVVSGVYTFGVRMNAPPPTEAYGASGPTRSEDVLRWLYFAALALLAGGLGFRLFVLPRSIPPSLEKRFYIVTGIGAVGIIQVGIAAFIMRAEDALQLPFGKLLYGDLSPVANGTRFGQAFIAMTLGFTWVTALLFLAWLTGRRAFLWPALVLALVFASGLSLSGHSAADSGSSWFTQLADWVHLSAAVLWVGGLVQLAVCVWPAAPELRRDAFLRFARLAPVLIAVLVAAGIYLSILRLPGLSDLWTVGYGQVLLVKLGLVSAALAWGGFHHFFVRPRLERTGWARRSLIGEGAVAMTILLLAAILVNAKPPVQPPEGSAQSNALLRDARPK
jgi:copper transport protein